MKLKAGLLLGLLALFGLSFGAHKFWLSPKSPETKKVSTPQPSKPAEATKAFDKQAHSLTAPSSLWIVVNKRHPLPKDYAPAALVTPQIPLSAPSEATKVSKVMSPALEKLVQAAAAQNIKLVLTSGYRSSSYQQQLYSSYVQQDGQTAADTYSARPGTSEHQTGLVADLSAASHNCDLEICFGNTAEGQWLAAHASDYGFIIRYPQGKEPITGYQYEPWHIRYVGEDLAKEMKRQNSLTLEEFFGLPAAPDYGG